MVLFWKEYFTIKYLTTRAGELLTLRLCQVQKQAWTSTLPSLGLKGLIKKSRWIYSLWGFAEWVQGLKKKKGRKKGNEPKKHCKKNKKNYMEEMKVSSLVSGILFCIFHPHALSMTRTAWLSSSGKVQSQIVSSVIFLFHFCFYSIDSRDWSQKRGKRL